MAASPIQPPRRRCRPGRSAAALLLLAGLLPAQGQVLAGRVRDRDGKPAANAELRLRWRMAPELPGLCGISLGDAGLGELRAASDDRGAFQLELPHRGPFELTALAGGDRSTPQFPCMAGGFVELALAAPFTASGTVLGADHEPLASVAVTLRPDRTAWTKVAAYRVPEVRGATTTDAEGRFALPFPDTYLRFPRWEPFVLPWVEHAGQEPSRMELLRPTQHCRELRLLLRPIGIKAGGVTLDARGWPAAPAPPSTVAIQVRLVTAAGPLADAAVLWSQGTESTPPGEQLGRTDAQGNVRIAAAAPGGLLLGFAQVGQHWLPFCRLQVAADGAALGTIAVAARVLRGQVIDAGGQPVPGARVAVLTEAPLPDELPYVTYADHGGSFQFDALPPGPLRAWADCGVHGFARVDVAAEQARATLRPERDGAVNGRVLDVTGQPVANAWVLLIREGNDPALMPGLRPGSTHLCVHSDRDGRVQVHGLPPGDWQVICNLVQAGLVLNGSTRVNTGGEFEVRLRVARE